MTIVLALGSALVLWALPGCEETLEVCPPCGSILAGDQDIVSEPRIDGTLESVQGLRRETTRMAARFDTSAQRLADGLGVALPANGDIQPLVDAITNLIAPDSAQPLNVQIRLPECFVDTPRALVAQHACEDALCSIDVQPGTGLCSGYLEGSCPTVEEGVCFSDGAKTCGETCIGLCSEMTDGECPGLCSGTCDGACSAYTSEGDCIGTCGGSCTGRCEADIPFTCNGACDGRCDVPPDGNTCADGDIFTGACNWETVAGQCRGHFYPEGCGDHCSSCSENTDDCRESAKYLGWAGLHCSGASVRFDLATTAVDAETLAGLRLLERELADLLVDHAALNILVDGADLREGDLASLFENNENSKLDDAMFRYINRENDNIEDNESAVGSPAAPTRGTYPLESLKARVYWLSRQAANAGGGYRIMAGTFDCLAPAMDDALYLLGRMVPTREASRDNGTQMVPDVACATVEPADPEADLPPCLYDLLDRQAAILAPLLEKE